MLGTGCLQQNNPTETPGFLRIVVPMDGMLQLITSTELPEKAAAAAGSTRPMGTRLPVKGTHKPGGNFACTVPMLQLGGEWDLKRGSGRELGGGMLPWQHLFYL